jgi:hypothetical protein
MADKPHWKGSSYKAKGQSETASKVFNVKVNVNYLNPQYDIDIPQENKITDQGLLLVGKIVPKQHYLPQFSLRWDEKDNHLNVDILPKEIDWESENNGYIGHTLQKVNQSQGRAFSLIIKIPGQSVIDAIITLNLARDMEISESIGVHVSTSYDVPTSNK